MIESISIERWSNACENFAQRHRGWLVSLSVLEHGGASDERERLHALDEPLLAIMAEPTLRGPRLCILVGREAARATHCSASPRLLQIEYGKDGRETGLRIEDRGGDVILLRFRETAPSQALHGLGSSGR